MLEQTLIHTHFADFGGPVHDRYLKLSEHELYVVDVVDLFDTYLAAFPEGTNPIFRVHTEHDCSCCKQFIRNLGKVVAIIDGKIETVWDFLTLPYPYNEVARTLDRVVRQAPIISVFRTKERKYGTDHNYDTETNKRWDHFHGEVADRHFHRDPATVRGRLNENAQMLTRACTELSPSAVETVLDLINDNALYRGEEHAGAVRNFKQLQDNFNSSSDQNLFTWANLDSPGVRFRNTAIGTLVTDLSNGVDLEAAVRMFEAKVAPTNYKRPTALITPKMIDAALAQVTALGLDNALNRRFARISDVSVNNVLFVDRSVEPQMKDSLRSALLSEASTPATKIDNPTPISVDDFLKLTPASMQVLVQNRHLGNFVSLTTSDDPTRLFKWDNPFAWSYDGDVTDSIKERVKKAGGNITAPFRVSLSWFNYDDLDLHCHTPNGDHIYYGDKRGRNGALDVDMNAGGGSSREPVENIVFSNFPDGTYVFEVNQFNQRETKDTGFELEFEYRGAIQNYTYNRTLGNRLTVRALEIQISHGDLIHVKLAEGLIGGTIPQEKWGVKTEQLVPVETMMFSPNHWDEQQVGARHLIFMLKGCLNPDTTRGIYNEFLRPEFEKHRKVFEVLGSKTKCPVSTEQLSGVGFTAARGDKVTVVADNRAYEVTF
jgi:hypothetical protein